MSRSNTTAYRDPVKARLAMVVRELSPTEWAGTVATVASAAERQEWQEEEVREILAMLGLTSANAKAAKAALRRSLRLRQVPTPKALPRPRTDQPGPRNRQRDALGRFANEEFCKKGLHKLTPENRVARRDRTTTQCRACTVARGKLAA